MWYELKKMRYNASVRAHLKDLRVFAKAIVKQINKNDPFIVAATAIHLRDNSDLYSYEDVQVLLNYIARKKYKEMAKIIDLLNNKWHVEFFERGFGTETI